MLLRAKIARYRTQLMADAIGPKSGDGGPNEGFDVAKSGSARVALIGFPSVGKSTLLSLVTDAVSATGSFEFTTLTAVPGFIHYEGGARGAHSRCAKACGTGD